MPCEFGNVSTLVFHSVRKEAGDDLFAIEPAKFEELVTFIKEKFDVLDFQNIQRGRGLRKTVRKRKVLLTFDDGYKDNYEYVFPILQKYRVKGLFFILPKYLGRNNLWNRRSGVILDHLSRREVQILISHGHSIGSHGMTHHRLTKFNDKVVLKELIESKQLLEEMFGIAVNSFAYPYGGFNSRVARIAGSVYKYCFATDEVPVGESGCVINRIRREYVWPHTTLEDIENLIINFGFYKNNPYKK